MYRVMLFGSGTLPAITQEVANAILALNMQGDCQFMLGDGRTADQAYNEFLSRAGLTEKSVVYGIQSVRNNKYSHPEQPLQVVYDSENKVVKVVLNGTTVHEEYGVEDLEKFTQSPKWGMILEKALARMCDIAICAWDGKTKNQAAIMDFLSIIGKPCYVYKIEI